MTILLFNNGTKSLRQLSSLLQTYGQVTATSNIADLKSTTANLVVLSGGSEYSVVNHPEHYQPQFDFLQNTSLPILGICLGAEIITYAFGGWLKFLHRHEKGLVNLQILQDHDLFVNVTHPVVYESHKWIISNLSPDLIGLARSQTGFEIIKHTSRPIYGFQFHPELAQAESSGRRLLDNLITSIQK